MCHQVFVIFKFGLMLSLFFNQFEKEIYIV